jgi:hypothetical protein
VSRTDISTPYIYYKHYASDRMATMFITVVVCAAGTVQIRMAKFVKSNVVRGPSVVLVIFKGCKWKCEVIMRVIKFNGQH